jgi:hypothetical protein
MSVAALEALALRDCLAEREGMHRLWERLHPRLSRIVDGAWQLAVQGDLAYPEAAGRRRRHVSAAVPWYLGRVHEAAASDEVVCRTFFDVANLLTPPRVLLHPRIGVRVFQHMLTDRLRRVRSV